MHSANARTERKLVHMKRIRRATIRISTSSDDLEAWFYEPGGKGPHPTVIMGHGLGAVKAGGLAPFAERFCAEDFAVVVIDYRQWGGSGGLPRGEVNIRRQQDDYRSAIEWAITAPSVDNSRIFLWGTSFSGMHALALAASETRLAGAIAQSPLVDGLAGSLTVRASRSAALFAIAVADRVGSLLGRAPLYVPGLVAPGQWGMFDTRDALYGKRLLAPREPVDWDNRIAARSILAIPFHRPVRRAADIKIPVLLVIAESDTQAPVKPALTVARRAPQVELRRSRGGHYDVYEGGTAFDEVIEWEVEFLHRHATAMPNP
jgi:pimeloyl-ACP methyl ester carboxylesterase